MSTMSDVIVYFGNIQGLQEQDVLQSVNAFFEKFEYQEKLTLVKEGGLYASVVVGNVRNLNTSSFVEHIQSLELDGAQLFVRDEQRDVFTFYDVNPGARNFIENTELREENARLRLVLTRAVSSLRMLHVATSALDQIARQAKALGVEVQE